MIRIILVAGLLLPQALRAQNLLTSFKPGTYTLTGNPDQRYQGKLKVHGASLEVLENPGSTKYYKAAEVAFVRMADLTRYRPISGFVVSSQARTIKPTLVQVVDSGQVMLMVYSQAISSPALGAGGSMMLGGTKPVFLLQRAGEEYPVALPDAGASRGGKNFREALATYVTQRPDLLKLLTDKEIVTDNLPYFIHALNTGQPFTTED